MRCLSGALFVIRVDLGVVLVSPRGTPLGVILGVRLGVCASLGLELVSLRGA